MTQMEKAYFEKRGQILVKNLRNRHFDAWYCDTKEDALAKVLELIPEGAKIGWGGVLSAQQIGLFDALRSGNYDLLDRDLCETAQEREQMMKDALFSDVFLTGANGLSLDGQMVNIDGTGNRVGAIIYGPKKVIVIAGMNKVCDTLEEAVKRAREVAAPLNMMRFMKDTPCAATGKCGDCKAEGCICNQIVITRHCRPVGRIQFVLVGEQLGL
jgi:L-lactate utilization protein LutB